MLPFVDLDSRVIYVDRQWRGYSEVRTVSIISHIDDHTEDMRKRLGAFVDE